MSVALEPDWDDVRYMQRVCQAAFALCASLREQKTELHYFERKLLEAVDSRRRDP